MSKAAPIKNFEKNLQALEEIVDSLESGDLSLEDALSHFEKGIKMTKDCQQALTTAEQRVQVLLEKNGQAVLAPFNEAE